MIGDNSEAVRASHTTTNGRRLHFRRCCTSRLKRSARARRHRFGTITGHFQAALKDSSVWTIVRLTTDLVTCPSVRINTVVNNSNYLTTPVIIIIYLFFLFKHLGLVEMRAKSLTPMPSVSPLFMFMFIELALSASLSVCLIMRGNCE